MTREDKRMANRWIKDAEALEIKALLLCQRAARIERANMVKKKRDALAEAAKLRGGKT